MKTSARARRGKSFVFSHRHQSLDSPIGRRASIAMGVLTRAKKRRLEERLADWISSLPDGVLGDIVSLLPTKDGARTQVLSSRWRHLWRAAPLNLDLHDDSAGSSILARARDISRILSVHPVPCRRFVMPRRYMEYPSWRTLDGWLRSPLLDNLQELDFNNGLLLPSSKSQKALCIPCSPAALSWRVCCYFTTADSVGCKSCPRASEVSVWILVVCVASGYNSSSLRTPHVWKDCCILEELK
ncbi:F-box/LRR-repeat protein At1g55660-like [Miscanthus floridulus]|uniref:F-box/LRR-repeat protein At1g55660-like n=1 Tax=Miscanthus floridulus TaxID=154761 RepID=UPI00345B14B2